MKREYAADTLKWNLTDLLTKEKDRAALDFLCECVDFLLKQPKPDAETGLMPCGCGWPSEVCVSSDSYSETTYFVKCLNKKCGCNVGRDTFGSGMHYTVEKAIDAWNKAVGGQK